jgi:hypothetical protein
MKVANEAPSFADLEKDTVYTFVIPEVGRIGERNGHVRYSVFLKVEGGPRNGARKWHDFATSDKPYPMQQFFEQMAAVGLTMDNFFSKNPSDEQVLQALVGRRFTAETYENEYEGKKSIRLRNFKPAVGSGPAAAGGLPAAPVAQAAPVAASAPVAPQAPAQGFSAPAQPDPWTQTPQAPAVQAPAGGDPWASAGLQAPPIV